MPQALFEFLKRKYGASAATTYCWLRYAHNVPAEIAFRALRNQIKYAGFDPGFRTCREVVNRFRNPKREGSLVYV